MQISNNLIDIFSHHKVASNLAMIMMVLVGLWAVNRINMQLDPTVKWPVVYVNAGWQGASAEDIERLVIVPIEQRLTNLPEMVEVRSSSVNGRGWIRIEFNHSADMSVTLEMVKDRVAQIRNFPVEMDPLRIQIDLDYEEIAVLLITSEGELSELMTIAYQMERELLAEGIDLIQFDGLPEEEIAIQVSSAKLIELNTDLDEIAREVGLSSSNSPAGTVGRGQGARQLRSLEQRRSAQGFEDLEITVQPDGRLVRLEDIATIERRTVVDSPRLTRDGKVAIELELYRLSDTDAIDSAMILHNWMDRKEPQLPQGVQMHLYAEVWVLLAEQLNVILSNGLSGLLLVIAALFLFLNGRVGWWVMIGIPVSFLFGIMLYYSVFGGSINILALITFIMALGIVVDDAIVVGEDAVTQFEQGKSPAEAAAGGAKRMFLPVVTSSLTTMAAFVPLLLTGGEMGQFIVTIPTVMLCVIVASLVECFLVLPGHLRHSFERIDRDKTSGFRLWFDARFIYLREHYYRPILELALRHPGATFCAALGCVVVAFSLAASGRVGVNFITGMSLEMLEANVEFSADATPAQKQQFLAHLEETMYKTDQSNGDQNINGYVSRVNSARLNQERKWGSQYGALTIEYAWEEDRIISPQQFVVDWRKKVLKLPFVEQLQVEVVGGANNGRPDITLILRGQDMSTLKTASEELQAALAGYQGVSNIFDDLPYGKDQIVFSLNQTGKTIGLTTETLGRQLRAAYNGRRVQIFNEDSVELEVLVMLPDEEREYLSSLKQFPIKVPGGELVALGTVADLENRRGIDVINHNNGFMSVSVNASVDPESNNTQRVLGHLRENALAEILQRYGLSSGVGGNTQQNEQIVEIMTVGAMLTLIFIYLILAWSFASYTWPIAVMTAIPLGLTGAIAGHWIMGMDIGAMSLLAFFSLTGIVVNDSIVLISFFRRGLDEGLSVHDAIRDASLSRFRAVALTSITTIAGLTPLMFETFSLAMYMVPIAITICFGLAFATLLVLLVIPALVVLIEGASVSFSARVDQTILTLQKTVNDLRGSGHA
ncbi:MAG: efflux RND transporter permease subunit [Pseudomonadales bacterium]|nr:efflux RND transporter permease subunit [Pseudomonadales bacterium]